MFADLVSHTIYQGPASLPAGRAYDYILAGNGLFKFASNRLISARLPLYYHPVARLPPLKAALTVLPERVPAAILYAVCRDARQAASQAHERMYLIRLNQHGPWRVTVPVQTASAASVRYQLAPRVGPGGLAEQQDIVCELHSHGHMPAFFSAIDDADELGFRFYAVIGRLQDDRPELLVRLGMYGDRWPLPANLLFTHAGPFLDRMSADIQETEEP
jgi:PRTRC genetic system protein A